MTVYRVKTSHTRPNVQGRASRINEAVVDSIVTRHVNIERKNSTRIRSLIGDICDFCHTDIFIKRYAVSLRPKGWKLACRNCYHKNDKEKVFVESRASHIEIKRRIDSS